MTIRRALAIAGLLTLAHALDHDLRGSYCRSRTDSCCTGRRDDCSAVLLGTECYCDEFCKNKARDCCPDYQQVCLGVPPAPVETCYYEGRHHEPLKEFKSNCNTCICKSMDNHMEVLCDSNVCLVDPEVIESVNRDSRRGWRAANHSMFWGHTLELGLTRRLGTLDMRRKVLAMTPLNQIIRRREIPREYDLRQKFPGWIAAPRDQGWCAASWAFSTVGVASDRWAIMTSGKSVHHFSEQHLVSCNKNQRGCEGGHLTRAWVYVKNNGIVSESCYPWMGESKRCRLVRGPEGSCPNAGGDTTTYRMGPVYRVISEEGIMWEILQSGSVQAVMKVHPDFFSYSQGIYRCGPPPPSRKTGFHSVRIIGWGEDPQTKYWIVANSWGLSWGENGYFRIKRGSNECRIEDFVLGAWINRRSRKPSYRDLMTNRP